MTTRFDELGLDAKLLGALTDQGYENPTEIQAQSIPYALEGKDVVALAQTGTGKTAAFSLPTLNHLLSTPGPQGQKVIRALAITPTRELALQVSKSFEAYAAHTKLNVQAVFGGVPIYKQTRMLRRQPDVLVATPGRLLDLIQQRKVFLDDVEVLILDEADRMLDMGFIHDIKRIIGMVPEERQTLFFSATMPDSVTSLAAKMLKDPARVEVAPSASVSERIEQRLRLIENADRFDALMDVLEEHNTGKTIVFSRTKHRADRTARRISREGVYALPIHSDRSQAQRQRALRDFMEGKCEVLVATDIVARGIDVDDVTLVVNSELPDDPENYVHRIGRTARAGNSGLAISLCDREELKKLKPIEKILDAEIPVDEDHDYHSPGCLQSCEYVRKKGSGAFGGRGKGGSRRRKSRGKPRNEERRRSSEGSGKPSRPQGKKHAHPVSRAKSEENGEYTHKISHSGDKPSKPKHERKPHRGQGPKKPRKPRDEEGNAPRGRRQGSSSRPKQGSGEGGKPRSGNPGGHKGSGSKPGGHKKGGWKPRKGGGKRVGGSRVASRDK